jgi:calcineurin-like phosphoesterase family protein
MPLVTSDWHLTDEPENEYRWQAFDALKEWITHSKDDDEIYHLGDLSDRKDKHSGALVNRIVDEFKSLLDLGAKIRILLGNHDKPLQGPPYWKILSKLTDIEFITEPTWFGLDQLWLPYSDNPVKDWDGIELEDASVIFMHQTVSGVVVNGRTLTNAKMPRLPRGVPMYSGDIHTPQKVLGVEYIGAPHQCRFGDDHICRMLELSPKTFKIDHAMILQPPEKWIVEVKSIKELEKFKVAEGDMVRVRFTMDAGKVEQWPIEEKAIRDWAASHNVHLASTETILEMGEKRENLGKVLSDPLSVLEVFAEQEGLEDDIYNAGYAILQEVLSRGV